MNLVGTIFLLRSDVYVLVYPIEQPQQKLLCVVLHIATILHAVPRHRGSKVTGNFRRHAPSPQRLHDSAKALRELSASSRPQTAASADWTPDVRLVSVGDKILRQRLGVCKALNGGVHKTRVAMVLNSDHAGRLRAGVRAPSRFFLLFSTYCTVCGLSIARTGR